MLWTRLRKLARERRDGLVAGLALLHLVTVCGFIWTGFADTGNSPFHQGARTYRNLAGIFRDYRFFAPNVASDMRAGFLLEHPDGSATFQDFLSDSLEVTLRYLCVIRASMNDKRSRDLMGRSWAALMLGSHPEATRVTVLTQVFRLPPSQDYAAGKQSSWKTIYAGTFDRQEPVR